MTPSGGNRKRGTRSLACVARARSLHSGQQIKDRRMTETDVVERKRAAEIPLHGPEAFEAMRRAGRMTAECLDMLVGAREARRHHRSPRPARLRLHPRPWRLSGLPALPRLHQVDLHLDQPRGLPRHPQRQAPARRRHHQYRRDPDPRRLAWRFEPHVLRGRGAAPGAAPVRDHLRMPPARHRGGASRARPPTISARPSSPMRRPSAARWCGISAATASARSSTTRRRSSITWSRPTTWS